MFEQLKKYNFIIVTGCQRAGTRIGAKCISNDTGHEYIDEKDFGTLNLFKFIEKFNGKPKVFHAPAMSSVMHFFGRPDILVVFIKRNREDIIKSQERISWDDYNESLCYHFPDDLISTTYDYAKIQSQFLNYIEINYEDLKDHSLFNVKKDRAWDSTI